MIISKKTRKKYVMEYSPEPLSLCHRLTYTNIIGYDISAVQDVQPAGLTFHQLTAATNWRLKGGTGTTLDLNVEHCTKMHI